MSNQAALARRAEIASERDQHAIDVLKDILHGGRRLTVSQVAERAERQGISLGRLYRVKD